MEFQTYMPEIMIAKSINYPLFEEARKDATSRGRKLALKLRAPLRKLTAAQSYIQEIELIKGTMVEAADEATARRTAWHSSNDEPLVLFRAIAQTGEEVVAAHAQYPDGAGGVDTGVSSLESVKQRRQPASEKTPLLPSLKRLRQKKPPP